MEVKEKYPHSWVLAAPKALTQRGAKLLDEGEYVTRFPSDLYFLDTET